MSYPKDFEFAFVRQIKPLRKFIDKSIAAGMGPTALALKLIDRGVRSPGTAKRRAANGGEDEYDPKHWREVARVVANVRRYCFGIQPKPKPRKPKRARRSLAPMGDLRDTIMTWTPELQHKEFNREL